MQAIIDACQSGLIPGEVVRVVSTSPETPALGRARAAGVETLCIDPDEHGGTETRRNSNRDSQDGQDHRVEAAGLPDRVHPTEFPSVSRVPAPAGDLRVDSDDLDARLLAAFHEVGADTIALAGFMRKLGPAFLHAFPQRILNIHAALLPCFGGQGFYGRRVHEAVIECGARFSGATVHFVDDEYDHGPIILQAVVPVADDDTPDTLAARVLEQEHRIYPEALRLLAEGRLKICGRRVKIRRD